MSVKQKFNTKPFQIICSCDADQVKKGLVIDLKNFEKIYKQQVNNLMKRKYFRERLQEKERITDRSFRFIIIYVDKKQYMIYLKNFITFKQLR